MTDFKGQRIFSHSGVLVMGSRTSCRFKVFGRLKQKTDDLQVICDNIYKNYEICRFTSKTR